MTPKNNHFMFTAGVLEEMFNGYGFEYLYFERKKLYMVLMFNVKKRDYKLRFGTDYTNTTAHFAFIIEIMAEYHLMQKFHLVNI